MNLGHVVFLAEADTGQVAAVSCHRARNYAQRERLTIDVQVVRRQGIDRVDLGPERSQHREGGTSADARGDHRHRRSTDQSGLVCDGMVRRHSNWIHCIQLRRRRSRLSWRSKHS